VKKCIYCNSEIEDDSRFCPVCGGNNVKPSTNNNSSSNYNRNIKSVFNTARNIRFFYGHIAIIIGSIITAITLIALSINNLMLGSRGIIKVEGTVTEVVEKTRYDENFNRDITEYYYVISYEYANKTYTYNTTEGISSNGEIGSKFNLYILPDHPEVAEMVSPAGLIFIGKVVFSVGMVMVAIGVVNIFIVSFKFVKAYKKEDQII